MSSPFKLNFNIADKKGLQPSPEIAKHIYMPDPWTAYVDYPENITAAGVSHQDVLDAVTRVFPLDGHPKFYYRRGTIHLESGVYELKNTWVLRGQTAVYGKPNKNSHGATLLRVVEGGNLHSGVTATNSGAGSRNPSVPMVEYTNEWEMSTTDKHHGGYNGFFNSRFVDIHLDCAHQCSGLNFGGAQMSLIEGVTIRRIASADPKWAKGDDGVWFREGRTPQAYGIRFMTGCNGVSVRDVDIMGHIWYVKDRDTEKWQDYQNMPIEENVRIGFWQDPWTQVSYHSVKPECLFCAFYKVGPGRVSIFDSDAERIDGPFIYTFGGPQQSIEAHNVTNYSGHNHLGGENKHVYIHNAGGTANLRVTGSIRDHDKVNRSHYASWGPLGPKSTLFPLVRGVSPTGYHGFSVDFSNLPPIKLDVSHTVNQVISGAGNFWAANNSEGAAKKTPPCRKIIINSSVLNGALYFPYSDGVPIGREIEVVNNGENDVTLVEGSYYTWDKDQFLGSNVVSAKSTVKFVLSDFRTWERVEYPTADSGQKKNNR